MSTNQRHRADVVHLQLQVVELKLHPQLTERLVIVASPRVNNSGAFKSSSVQSAATDKHEIVIFDVTDLPGTVHLEVHEAFVVLKHFAVS